ncbi:MAG: hypothetical protein RBR77_16505 [Thauera sp.]|jgi:hypothetical protein|nr:hypothetical protein [Thauera sp.]
MRKRNDMHTGVGSMASVRKLLGQDDLIKKSSKYALESAFEG